VRGVEGVEPVGTSSSPWRMQVEATPNGILDLQDAAGEDVLIEPIIRHDAFVARQND